MGFAHECPKRKLLSFQGMQKTLTLNPSLSQPNCIHMFVKCVEYMKNKIIYLLIEIQNTREGNGIWEYFLRIFGKFSHYI